MHKAWGNAKGVVIGIIGLGLLLAAFGGCQILQQYVSGKTGDKIPPAARGLLPGAKQNQEISLEYFNTVADALNKLQKVTATCNASRSQSCLTEAFEALHKTLPDSVPTAVSWMSASNKELKLATYDVLLLHRDALGKDPSPDIARTLVANPTTRPTILAYIEDTTKKTERFAKAVDAWDKARR